MNQAPSQRHDSRGLPGIASAVATCVAAASLCAWLYAPYGYNGLDDGFIQALSWRVVNGQLPYLDFVYIRPPGSVLLHTLPMLLLPPELQVIFERWWLFVAVAVYSFLAEAALTRVADLRAWRLPRHVPALLFFVASVQDFPPMAWHTVDGVLFATLAVFCVCCTRGSAGLALGALSAVLSASCKQPFFAVPVAAALYVAYTRGRRDAAIFASAAGALAAVSFAVLSAYGMLAEGLRQCTATTSPASLVYAGLLSYARGVPYFLVPVFAWWVFATALRRAGRIVPSAWMAYAAVLWIFGSDIVRTLVRGSFQTPAFNYPGALFVVAALAIGIPGGREPRVGRLDGRARAALALLLLVAWCASISWGYPTPVLFSAPLWFGALSLAASELGAAPRRVVLLALPLALAAQFTGYRYPYRESPRAELTVSLGATFGRLSHVFSSPANRERFEELRRFEGRYPRFTVLPALPSAHYLTGRLPPIGVDWARNAETGGRTAELIRELDLSEAYVFMERAAEPPCRSGPGCSELADHVASHWSVVADGKHFRVYRRGDRAHALMPDPPVP